QARRAGRGIGSHGQRRDGGGAGQRGSADDHGGMEMDVHVKTPCESVIRSRSPPSKWMEARRDLVLSMGAIAVPVARVTRTARGPRAGLTGRRRFAISGRP